MHLGSEFKRLIKASGSVYYRFDRDPVPDLGLKCPYNQVLTVPTVWEGSEADLGEIKWVSGAF